MKAVVLSAITAGCLLVSVTGLTADLPANFTHPAADERHYWTQRDCLAGTFWEGW